MFGFVFDMDGVLYRGNHLIPGTANFIRRLQASGRPYLFLTNNPSWTPEQLSRRLNAFGMSAEPHHFYTAAQATAEFLVSQVRRPRVFAMGDIALKEALRKAGARLTERHPDYVVVGGGRDYTLPALKKAINLVNHGARLIGTNPDLSGPTETGIEPGCGALIAPIERATGRKAYFIGKPNPLMMRIAVRKMGIRSSQAYMVGDRMDTDIVGGMETGMKTILVLSGVTKRRDLKHYPYRPNHIFKNVAHIPLDLLP